jgi:CO/xanthine dehydrogenase Mo-binding subunit
MGRFGVGQAIRRVEDERFLTGAGRYTDDIKTDGEAYLYVLRSPHAHAEIASIDVDAWALFPRALCRAAPTAKRPSHRRAPFWRSPASGMSANPSQR